MISNFARAKGGFGGVAVSCGRLMVGPAVVASAGGDPLCCGGRLLTGVRGRRLGLAGMGGGGLQFKCVRSFISRRAISSVCGGLGLGCRRGVLFMGIRPGHADFSALLIDEVNSAVEPPSFCEAFEVVLPMGIDRATTCSDLVAVCPLYRSIRLGLTCMPYSLPSSSRFVGNRRTNLGTATACPGTSVGVSNT